MDTIYHATSEGFKPEYLGNDSNLQKEAQKKLVELADKEGE